MIAPISYRFLIAGLVIAAAGNAAAQADIQGGTVKYEQIIKYDFEAVFGGRMVNPRARAWVASLPTEGKEVKVLYFTEEEALYTDVPGEQEAPSEGVDHALVGARYMMGPSSELVEVYYDFGRNKKIEHVEFMTREFLVTDVIERKSWKLTNGHTRILDYACQSAELKRGDQSITAWFTSEIPFSTGPDEYFGLPGLILAIEVDGETALFATSIDLTLPPEGMLTRPSSGRRVTQAAFDRIVKNKTIEFEETRSRRWEHRPH